MKTIHLYGHLESPIEIGKPAYIHAGRQVLYTSVVQHCIQSTTQVDIITQNTHYILHLE